MSNKRLSGAPKSVSSSTKAKESSDVRAEKIAEVQSVLRNSIGVITKGKVGQAIEMQLQKTSWTIKVAACETREDFLALFALHKIPEDVWRVSTKLMEAGFYGLYDLIRNRFGNEGGWEGFLKFMEIQKKGTKGVIDSALLSLPFTEQVAACETREDFLALFALHKIPEDVWRVSRKLIRAGFKPLYGAIWRRFTDKGGWEGFLEMMGPKSKLQIDKALLSLPFTEQVAACETREDFLALFALHKIPEDVWRVSTELTKKGFRNLYYAIRQRFADKGGWGGFLKMMGPRSKRKIDKALLSLPFTEQVAACETREDFLALFALHKIPEDVWRNSGKLVTVMSYSFYRAIMKRFADEGGWEQFIAFMDGKDESTLDSIIERLNLNDAVALLSHQPSKLKAYLSIAHPELSPSEIDQLVSHSFSKLHTKRVYDYSDFELALKPATITASPKRTKEAAAEIQGQAKGADTVLIEGGASVRRVAVGADGTFDARIALQVAERNTLQITPIHHGTKLVGPATECIIHQTGESDDIEALVTLLDQMGKDVLEGIRSDPGRHEYVVRQSEQALIRKFSGSFAKGKAYVEKLIRDAKSPAIRRVLSSVLKRFAKIDAMKFPNIRKGEPLYFFQKYCVAEIQRAITEGKRGIVLANDPGLGKTRTALVAVNGDPATIVTPNSVVTSWAEEADKALVDSDVMILQAMHSKERKEKLRTSKARHTVTNVEFLRSVEGDERYDLLSDEDTILVQDEAHGLLNLATEQSKGARRLKQKFLLLLSATPAKDPKTLRRILHLLEPSDPRFSSDKAFTKAFPGNDPQALKTLHLLKQQYMIRFTKEDVLETMGPKKPIKDQRHCLPKKEYVPESTMGSFTLTDDQCEAIYELLLNFPEWCRGYDRYVPKDDIARLDQLRGNSNALVKTHALRQTANNPGYVGSKSPDPKAKEMKRTVDAILAEGRKVVIFCQYNAQAQKYAELLKSHSPSVYTGVTSKQGYKAGKDGDHLLYKRNEHGGWVMDARGLPKEDPEGEPMLALDYERLAFQHSPERRIMISTYAAGAVGVTFTAGKATIFDDLPDDVVKEIQAEDRTHRIDHEHQTHHSVKYVRMVSEYPEKFLEQMKQVWVRRNSDGTYTEVTSQKVARQEELETAYETFFEQGTYDEVRLKGLQTQRTRFRLINDGIADVSELPEIQDLVT